MMKDKWNILKLCLEVEDDKVGQLSRGYFWRMKFVAVKMRMADAGKFSRSYFGSIILPFFRSTKEEKAIKLWWPNKLRLCKSVSVIQTRVHIFAKIQPLSVSDIFQETALPWAMTLASIYPPESILEQP